MKATDIRLYRYRLPLVSPLQLKDTTIIERTGLIVELSDSHGNTGLGESAPLPKFSGESPAEVEEELKHIRRHLPGNDLPERIDGGFDDLLGGMPLSPSTRFGIETAILNLTAVHRGTTLAGLLGADGIDYVKVNALLSGTRDELLARAASLVGDGYSCCKLKIGGISVDNAVNLIRRVRETIGDGVALRVDANRGFTLGEAIRLMRSLGPFDVEYVEEPAQNLNQLRKLLGEKNLSTGVALDESLREIRPPDLSLPFPLKAIVIKPTLLGFQGACRFALAARENGIAPVISSSFETSVGSCALAALAAAAGGAAVVAGLDTLNRLGEDLVENPPVVGRGQIALTDCDIRCLSLRHSLLEEIAGD